MQRSEIQAHVHFRHTPQEVAELNRAVTSMREHILAVSTERAREKIHNVLAGDYFRAADAALCVATLLAAAKHAKLYLGDFFPLMRAQILDDALALEEAAINYRIAFAELATNTVPTL